MTTFRMLLRALLPVLVLLLVLSLLCHWFLLRPRFKRISDSTRTVEGLENAVSGMHSTLRALPAISEEEVRMWKAIDQRLIATFGRGEDLAATISVVADVAQKAGASLVSVTFEEPESSVSATLKESGTSRSQGGVAPRNDGRESASTGGSTTRQGTASPPGTAQEAAQRPRPRSVVPRKASDALPPASTTKRPSAAKAVSEEAKVDTKTFRAGSVTGVFHPATLRIAGDYASWVGFLAGCSQAYAPVVIDRLQGEAGTDAHQLSLSVRIPAVGERGGTAAGGTVEGGVEPSPVAISAELAQLYHLDRLREPLSAAPVPSSADPFPSTRAPVATIQASRFHVTAIMERNGQYVAVVNGEVVTVGDKIGGVAVLEITPETVIFSQNE